MTELILLGIAAAGFWFACGFFLGRASAMLEEMEDG